MSESFVRVERHGREGRIVVNRPDARNAINLAAAGALAKTARGCDRDEDVRVITLTGAGDAMFSAGADLKELPPSRETPAAARAYDDAMSAAVAAFADCNKPTVALLNGPALGLAIGFAMACDIRIASRRAFFRVPVPKLGLFYAPADTARLVRLVGPGRAKWLMMTGGTIDADTAFAWGLVDSVFGGDDFAQEGRATVDALASAAPLSLRYTKRIIDGPTPADPALIGEAYERIYSSGDPAEGMAAWRENRAPAFRGR